MECHVHDIRAWSNSPHRKVDDRPFGGGPGMVFMCDPLVDAVEAVEKLDSRAACRVLLTPQGEPLRQSRVEWLAKQPRLLLIAGHYEGIDERAIQELRPLELSVGDFTVSGGELPALLVVDAVSRLLPGVLGHECSAAQDSFSLRDEHGNPLLDCPTSPVRARGAAGMFPRSCSRATTRQSRRGGWNNRSVARVCVGRIYLEAPPLSRKNSSGKC